MNTLSPENDGASIGFGGGGYNLLVGDRLHVIFPDMGTKTLMSPEEYLATHFPEREPEYVHGEIKEKPLPDRIHGHIQIMLGILLAAVIERFHLGPGSEVRSRLAPDLYRLPDFALFRNDAPYESVPSIPPVMVAEIISKDDQRVELIQKLREYAAWGVPHIWIIDPWTRRLAVWKNDTEVPVEALTLPEYEFEVRLDQLLKGLPL
jgi:Uma2 family endonuclease